MEIVFEDLAVDLADNGEKACELAAQSQSAGNPYNVILMDMQMPKMNGRVFLRRVRYGDSKHNKIPIIFISSDI